MLRERKREVRERGREGGRERAGESERESERARENDHMGLQPLPESEVERKKERERERSHRPYVLSTHQWPAKCPQRALAFTRRRLESHEFRRLSVHAGLRPKVLVIFCIPLRCNRGGGHTASMSRESLWRRRP